MSTEPNPASAKQRRFQGLPEDEVLGEARKGSPAAIRELGFRKSPESLTLLRTIVSSQEDSLIQEDAAPSTQEIRRRTIKHEKRKWMAKVALASRGDKDLLKEILALLESPDPATRMKGINALSEIGNRRAAKHLAALLSDSGRPQSSGHVVFITCGQAAASALGVLFPEAKEELFSKSGKKYLTNKEWSTWWLENRTKHMQGLED